MKGSIDQSKTKLLSWWAVCVLVSLFVSLLVKLLVNLADHFYFYYYIREFW